MKSFWTLVFFLILSINLQADAINESQEVAESASSLERLLKGLKESQHLDENSKKKIIDLLTDLKKRDIEFEVDTIIEDIQHGDYENAHDNARSLHSFLIALKKKLREDSDELKNNAGLDLESILKEQSHIREQLQKILKESGGEILDQLSKLKEELDSQSTELSENNKKKETLEKLINQSSQGDNAASQELKSFLGEQDAAKATEKAKQLLDRIDQANKNIQKSTSSLSSSAEDIKQNLEKNKESPLNTEQNNKSMEDLLKSLKAGETNSSNKKLEKLMQSMREQMSQNMSEQEKKTIEHLAEKQSELADKLNKAKESIQKQDNTQDKESIQAAVDQMNKIRNQVSKGELDSGIWESLQLEENLKELIAKQHYELNKYAMDQRFMQLSDFIEFLEELKQKQVDLHAKWTVKLSEKELAHKTFEVQKEILMFSKSRDMSLQDAQSISYLYGMKQIQQTISSFALLLEQDKIPSLEDQDHLLKSMQDLIDGMKSLKGQLSKNQRERPKKRESHQGQDIDQAAVSLIEEMRYLRMVQMRLNELRLNDPDNSTYDEKQKEVVDLLFQLKAKWDAKKEGS